MSLKLSEILLTTLKETPVMMQKQISDDFSLLKNKITESETTQETAKQKRQKQFLKIYLSVLEKINKELQMEKLKYQNLDKEKLKTQRCLKLAEDINFFRSKCYDLKKQLAKAKMNLKEAKLEENFLIFEKGAYKKSITRTKSRSKTQKVSFKDLLKTQANCDRIQPVTNSKAFARSTVCEKINWLERHRPLTAQMKQEKVVMNEKNYRRSKMVKNKYFRKTAKSIKTTHNTFSLS